MLLNKVSDGRPVINKGRLKRKLCVFDFFALGFKREVHPD